MALAAFVSAFSIAVGMKKKEQALFKLLIYPLMFRCLITKLVEVGLFPSFKHGDILAYFAATSHLSYCQIVEKHSQQPQMYNMIN